MKRNKNFIFIRLDLEESLSQQREWQNQFEIQMQQQKGTEDILKSKIALLENYQRSSMERATEHENRIRHLFSEQNILKITIQQDKDRTSSIIENLSSNIRQLRDKARYHMFL